VPLVTSPRKANPQTNRRGLPALSRCGRNASRSLWAPLRHAYTGLGRHNSPRTQKNQTSSDQFDRDRTDRCAERRNPPKASHVGAAVRPMHVVAGAAAEGFELARNACSAMRGCGAGRAGTMTGGRVSWRNARRCRGWMIGYGV